MAQQAQQQSGGDNSMAPVWLTILLFCTLGLLWYVGHAYIVAFVFSIITVFAEIVDLLLPTKPLAQEIYLMQTLDPAAVEWAQMILLLGLVGAYIRYPFGFILAVLAVVLYRSDITQKFRRAHSMKTLRAQEQVNWPSIMPIVKLDLANQDISVGPWAMALTPMEFARKYNLLKKNDALVDTPLPGMEWTAGIRRADAKRVFTLQLGPYWQGFDHCPPAARALAAVFMARMNRDRAAASAILVELDKGFASGRMNFDVANKTLNQYKNAENVQEVVSKHAYLLTVMASLLKASRDDGVVASAEFLWLKPVDRRLWYMLNSVGRQTPFAEVGGPFAHWRAEQVMGRSALAPMVDEAIKALEIAIREIKLSPKELQELKAQ